MFSLKYVKENKMESISTNTYRIIAWAVILFMVLIVWLFRKTLGKPKKMTREEIVMNGVLADAIVLSIQETDLYINDLPQMKLQMQIKPNKGRNFVTEIQQVIPKTIFGPLHTGSKILVKYDPGYPREIVLFKSK